MNLRIRTSVPDMSSSFDRKISLSKSVQEWKNILKYVTQSREFICSFFLLQTFENIPLCIFIKEWTNKRSFS